MTITPDQDLTPIPTVDELAGEFTAVADRLWDAPELRWQETASMRLQAETARQHGFTVTEAVGGIPTAFSAEFGTGGPVIAFLGEYDALAGLSQESGALAPTPDPANVTGAGHGCGHHLLGAGSLLAAVATARTLEASGLPGRVRYYGCPAEEAAAGKSFMVKAGAFADVDAAITWHPFTRMVTRQMEFLAYTQAYFSFTGVASHAGSAPEHGRSALDALELMNIGINFLREHIADDARIHYAITDSGGQSPNVVQAHATAYYIVRAADVRQMRELYERVLHVAQGAALMTDTVLTVEFDGASSHVLPNVVLESVLHGHAARLGGVPFDAQDIAMGERIATTYESERIAADRARSGLPSSDRSILDSTVPALITSVPRHREHGSTDVGDVSWVTPTVQIFSPCFTLGAPPHSWQWVTQGKLPAAHKGMIYAAKVMASTATTLITDHVTLARARAEYADVTSATPYDSPIPDGVIAPPNR
ncbi:amidohydrolase [Tsukamurella sp. NPDC003166]|uniref:amidohydrolase n=1 Tax=Tsukamurella sp. NPDC003166 TaxID=3154444 RepID=UPI0033A6A863